ncbi:unnamed protein product [Cunninghamella blakesleeana]
MLKPKLISQVLRQSLYNGVKSSLLMTYDGSLLAFATDNDKNAKIYAAITANIWNSYKKQIDSDSFLQSNGSDSPLFLLLECEEGNVFITSIGTLLLCLVAETSVNLGILKAKTEALKVYLEEPLLRAATYREQ